MIAPLKDKKANLIEVILNNRTFAIPRMIYNRLYFKEAEKDVERFLEDKSELRLFDAKLIKNSIGAVY